MESKYIGRTIDSYQILEVLGKGGMGIVYRARDLMLEKDVAVKMMDVPLDPEGALLKRFQEEARALARLQHPNIVAIYALRESQIGFCIVMELVKGRGLSEIIKNTGPLPLPRVKSIFLQCLNALVHAHKEGIIHRDIKPSNIMLTDEDVVKITDFGLAKRLDPSSRASTMLVGGTLYYSPPEQLDGLANVDFRGDIYSLGMTMYEALTGRVPFSDTSSDFRIRQAIVEGHIPPPDTLRPDLPDDFVQLVMKAIHNDPARRFRSAAAMLEALEQCATAPAAKARIARRRPSRMATAFALGVLVLAIGGVILYVSGVLTPGPKTVSGSFTVVVREQSGSPIPGASIIVGGTGDSSGGVVITDARTERSAAGRLATTANYMGESSLRYRGARDARLEVAVEADSYAHGGQAFRIPADSVVVVLSRLRSEPAAETEAAQVTVSLHDGEGNPVPGATISLRGGSGKVYSAQTDLRGRALIANYPGASEGSVPTVRIGVDRLKSYAGKAKPEPLGPDMSLSLDVNDFVPYDQTLKDLRKGAETLLGELRKARGRVIGSEAEKRADPDYQRGLERQTLGERQLQDRAFEDALSTFLQAKDSYTRSADNLAAKRSGKAPGSPTAESAAKRPPAPDPQTAQPERPVPENREPPKKETPRKEAAPPDIRAILTQFKAGYEQGDLAGLTRLLQFSTKEQSAWSTFFDVADNVEVTTAGERVQRDTDNAQVTFDASISYRDKNDGGRKKIDGLVTLGLHYENGTWETTSHQFRK